MSDVVIFGIGDVARLAHFYFTNDSEHRVVGFAVDAEFHPTTPTSLFEGLPLITSDALTERFPPSTHKMFVALGYSGMNRHRRTVVDRVRTLGYVLVSYISSRCSLLTKHPVGDNCFILEDNTVQPFVTIGENVTLWSGNHIGHDTVIEDDCFITSHVVVSGHCRVGRGSFLGVNATLRNSITIAPYTLIGAGGIIMEDTAPEGVYVPQRSKRIPKSSFNVSI